MEKKSQESKKHPWEARLCVGILMLLMAFFGMVVTDVRSGMGAWDYWKWAVGVYAILALWLSWYIRRQQEVISPITLGHELLHWIGVIGTVFMISFFVKLGVASRFLAGIIDLTILSLGVFLAGVYIEPTFLFIGLVLGAFAIMSAVVVQYLYAIVVPIILGAMLVLGLMIWFSHQNITNTKDKK